MRKHRTVLPLLVGVLLATLASSQAQEQLQVLVAGDRTAVVELHRTDGEDGLSGDLEASADLAEGSSAFRADLGLEDAGELGDGTVGAFLTVTGDTMEAIGKADLPVPDEDGDAPDALDLTVESVTGGNASSTRVALEMAGPADQLVPEVALSGTTEGSSDALSGSVDYSVTLPEGRAGQIPVTDLSLALADETTGSGESETVTTTLTLSVTAPRGSQVGQQLRQASQAEMMIEQQLKLANVQVEKVDVPPVEETDDALTASATVVVRDLRGTLDGLIDTAGPGMVQDPSVDPQVMTASLKKLIEPRIDEFELTMNVDGRTVSGEVGGEISRLKEFLGAYMDIVRMASRRAETAREDSVPDELAPYVTAMQEASLEQTVRSLQVMMESDMSFRGDGELNLSSAGGTTDLDAEFDLSVDDYRDFAEKARAAGVPAADTALVTAGLHLTDADRLEGRYYAYTDADLLGSYQNLVLEALARADGDEETASIIEEVDLEEAAFSLSLEGRDLKARGYSRTTPLTRAARALLDELRPEVDGTPTGARLDYVFRPDGTGEGEVSIHFSDFMPDRSAAEIREALGLPEAAAVRMDASPDEVALTRVDRPEVEVSTGLADVRSSAQSLAARGPADEEGGRTWLLIAGALLVAVLLGVGWAAARRGA